MRDAAITVAPTVLVLVMSTSSVAGRHGSTANWTLAVLLAQALPLLVVRRVPRAVLAWTATVTTVAVALGLPLTNGMVAQAIAAAFVVARTGWPASDGRTGGRPCCQRRRRVSREHQRPAAVRGGDRHVAGSELDPRDTARRRSAVHAAMETELTRRTRHHRLQAEVGALSERLTIARELHSLVGEGLDAVVVQAGAARTRLGTPEAIAIINAIETVARGVLIELDRFLTLLRQDVPERDPDRTSPIAPVAIPESRRSAWLGTRGPGVTLIGTAAAVSLLTWIDVADVPQNHTVPGWWPAAFGTALAPS
jgi:signal transduction histidine kinase